MSDDPLALPVWRRRLVLTWLLAPALLWLLLLIVLPHVDLAMLHQMNRPDPHRVIPQVRRIEQAGASSDREMVLPSTVETTARAVTARLDSEPLEPSAFEKPPELEPALAVPGRTGRGRLRSQALGSATGPETVADGAQQEESAA